MNTRIRLTAFRAAICGLTALTAAAAPGKSFEGFTEPFRKIDVAAAETGTVASLLVREGDRVADGQPLAVLDNEVLEVSREIANANIQAKGKLESAQAERDLRKTRFERLQSLRAQGHASQEEIDRAHADLAVAEGNLHCAREQHLLDELERKKIEAMIERRTVRSPIDGVVTKLHKDTREFVSATSASVLTVVQLNPLRVTFSIPTSYAVSMAVGQAVTLEFPEGNAKAQGKVELVAPITEAESGTVRVKVLLENPKGQYRCGVRCSVNLDAIARQEKASPTLAAGSAQP